LAVPGIEEIATEALKSVPGLSVAVRKGNAYFSKGWGRLDLETNVPVSTGAIFEIASVSKQFTAAAILRLAEEGRLKVDDPVRRFVPELDARFDAITIRHLLNHTSGIPDHLSLIDSPEPLTQQQFLELVASRPPAFPAGAAWAYSNSGYFLLGIVIERASNRSYAQYLRDAFFEPLQLFDTSYCGTNGPQPRGYVSSGGEFVRAAPFDLTYIFAAGALCSSATDLVRWNRALTNGIAVSPASYASMTGEGVEAYIDTRYGFGLYVDTFNGHPRIWHNGLIYGFQSEVSSFPDDDVTIVVLINFYALRDRAGEITDKVAKAILSAPN
jgi:CubicO group peptidase (beta-lactamase class C family)